MSNQAEYKPVGDEVPKVDGAVAVGEDLEFQRRWWSFERGIWIFFGLVLIADLSGLLGRGPLANAELHTTDGSLHVKYERVERANTSSIVTILPGGQAMRDGKVRLFVSDTVLRQLGAQRVIPQPENSVVGGGGVTYTFAVSTSPITIQIELKPSFIGPRKFAIGVPGEEILQAKTVVLP